MTERFPPSTQSPGVSPTRNSTFQVNEMASNEVIVDLDERKVDFTELPPQRLLCDVCNRVFRNPYSTSCCGKTFCLKCVESTKQCPSCDEERFEISRDSTVQQSINDLYVRCSHVAIGCMWFGKLELLPRHLENTKAKGGGCMFVTVPCPNECGSKYTKKTLRDHLLSRCPKRQYDCDYCGKYNGTYETVEAEHFPICPQFPLPCPNKCPLKTVARSKLDFHLKNQCEHQDNVPCVMAFAGCTETLLRKNMSAHVQKNLLEHMMLFGNMFDTYKQSIEEKLESLPPTPVTPFVHNGLQEPQPEVIAAVDKNYEERLQAKEAEIKQMKAELHRLEREKDEQGNSLMVIIESLRRSLELQEQRLQASEELNQTFTKDIARLRQFLPSPLPLTYTISKFDQLKQTGKWWYSRPFYSHYCGYKFGMFVFSNGVLDGKGSHISVFLYLVRGEYDEELEWPFRGSITIQLLNQRSDRGHHQRVIKFTEESPPSVSSRVINGEMAKEGNGPTQFISHADLSYNAEKDTEYVRDDSLRIRVSAISIRGVALPSRGMDTLPRRSRAQMDKSASIDLRQDAPASPLMYKRSVKFSTSDQPKSPTTPKSPITPLSPFSPTTPTSPIVNGTENGTNGNNHDTIQGKNTDDVAEEKTVTIDL